MRPLFNVPGEGAFALIMGIISGYPTGAKIVTKFRQDNICTKEECERLLAFTNNSGPLFIVTTVGISLFYDSKTGLLLLFTHVLACLSVGIIFRFWKYKKINKYRQILETNSNPPKVATISNLGEILAISIINSINTIIIIGGFIMLFSVIISILEHSNFFTFCSLVFTPLFNTFEINSSYIIPFLTGFIELTNGVSQVATINTKSLSTNIIICAFLLGFGGISILLQVFSIISKTDISIKPYIFGKLLHGFLAALYTFLILQNCMFFNLDI